jgi:hypothetical protein
MAVFVDMFKTTDNKWNYQAIFLFVVAWALIAWVFFRLTGKTQTVVTTTTSAGYRPSWEGLEIVTTDNSLPSTPISKVPLNALGTLAQNNKRRYLPGFDMEGVDQPT